MGLFSLFRRLAALEFQSQKFAKELHNMAASQQDLDAKIASLKSQSAAFGAQVSDAAGKVNQAIADFQAKLASNPPPPGVDFTPELNDLQAAADALTQAGTGISGIGASAASADPGPQAPPPTP